MVKVWHAHQNMDFCYENASVRKLLTRDFIMSGIAVVDEARALLLYVLGVADIVWAMH